MIKLPPFVTDHRFAPLFGTQFLGAFNDNLFKTALFVMIGYHGLGADGILPAAQMLNLGALLFILPYFLFSSLSGEISSKYNKAALARVIKLAEIGIMAVAAFGFYLQSAVLLMAMLFCMGMQSALFGPLKYAALPEYLGEDELMLGNSLIESGTFLAILTGQIIGTLAASAPFWLVGTLTVSVAALGALTAARMPDLPAANPQQKLHTDIAGGTRRLLRDTAARPDLQTAIIGISWFWFVGAVYTTQLPTFVRLHLGGSEGVFNLMLTLFSIGIAAGSVLCAKLSRHQVRLGWVSLGTAGLGISGLLLVLLSRDMQYADISGIGGFLARPEAYSVMAVMLAIGLSGGFFSVPLYTWLQTASDRSFRAHAVAANNIINAVFMVAAAVLSSLLLWLSDSILLLYFTVSVGNFPMLAYLIYRKRYFLDFRQC
ncbi:MAG: MFS transporter [Neisseria sp.]|nr:MFS transporter [Neisseria sp.]